MKIAVVGATGRLGRSVTAQLALAGHEVVALGRRGSHPVDIVTGAGLVPALDGCEVVIDASNTAKHVAGFFAPGTRKLLAAEKAAGVGHHVCVSIVGCDLVPGAYYEAKAEQERVVMAGDVPWSILRATQFHEYLAGLFASTARYGLLPLVAGLAQPVAVAEVAPAAARIAAAAPLNATHTIAGPEVRDMRELARSWKRATGSRAVPIPIRITGTREMRSGALTIDRADEQGRQTFDDWLPKQPAVTGPVAHDGSAERA